MTGSNCSTPRMVFGTLRVSPELADVCTPSGPLLNPLHKHLAMSLLGANSGTGTPASCSGRVHNDCGFAALPDHLLEEIFFALRDSNGAWPNKKVLLAVCSVCQSWRYTGRQLFFSDAWEQGTGYIHPYQLFRLSPKPVEGGLLRCFIRRTTTASSALSRALSFGHLHGFTMYHGSDHNNGHNQFLMAAIQTNRRCYKLSIVRDSDSAPVALLRGNVSRTRYALTPGRGDWVKQMAAEAGYIGLPSGMDHSISPTSFALMRLSYQMRMRGIMLPRRMKVEVPYPQSVQHNPLYGPLPSPIRSENDVPLVLPGPPAQQQQQQQAQEAQHPDVQTGLQPRGPAPRISSGGESVDVGQMLSKPQQGPRVKGEETRVIQLKNKPPHWNESLKCWCLNFRGRVKMASVKNFQLMCSQDTSERVVMQFGKVDRDTYILDFDPCVLSAVQAFTICLSTFESKFFI